MFYAIMIVLLLAADQVLKFWVRGSIPLHGTLPLFPNFMDLSYLQNTGAAFSSFSDRTWLLTVISAGAALVILVLLLRRSFSHPIAMFSLSLVFAGAVGNLIDRFLFGYVTDMFHLLFISFPVFNIADICVTVGGVVFCLYLVFAPKNKGGKYLCR